MLEGIDTLKRGANRSRPCAVTAWLSTLDEDDREHAERILKDREIHAPAVRDFFNLNGAEIANPQTITRHRSKICCTRLAA